MARLEYPALTGDDVEAERVASEVRAMRSGAMLNLYRMMLHAPDVCERWLGVGTALRFEITIEPRLRELVIACVARLTGSSYEWAHHAPIARREGATEAQLESLPWALDEADLDEADRVALEYARCVATGTAPPPETWSALQATRSARQITELTALAAFYVATARFLSALDVDLDQVV